MKAVEVVTPNGRVRGVERNGVAKFQGIPYALPPTGERRFSPARPARPWQGVLDAAREAPVAPQAASDLEGPMGAFSRPMSEDCLTLAVASADLSGRLPVAVWFHGGANMSGAGNLPWYDGEPLARRGRLVVVGVNFRIGALGFLHHRALNTENLSIGDQIAALRWVRENIASFGGDPGNVTVFGQSAGANAIVHLMALPETEGLFQRAVLESPSIGRANHAARDAEEVARAVFEGMGLSASDPELRGKLLAKTPQDFLRATAFAYERLGAKYAGMLFKPVKDEWSTAGAAIEAAVREGVRRKLPVVIGTTADEMLAFSTARDAGSVARLRAAQLERYDVPAERLAEGLAAGGCPVWKYRFEWRAPRSVYGSCHTLELPFVFGTAPAWKGAGMLEGAAKEEMERLADAMQPLWCEFFARGGFSEAVWPAYDGETRLHKIFDNASNPVRSLRFSVAGDEK